MRFAAPSVFTHKSERSLILDDERSEVIFGESCEEDALTDYGEELEYHDLYLIWDIIRQYQRCGFGTQ